MITDTNFNNALAEFKKSEETGTFYDMVIKLLESKFEVEAYLFLMATWNFAAFRYAIKEFDIKAFEKLVRSLEPAFNRLKGKNFKTIKFDDYRDEITEIYNTLSHIKGVGYTGTSKIMHLKNRDVFVMWDDYIGMRKSRKYYDQLPDCWKHDKFDKDAGGYIEFLKYMQEIFKDIDYRDRQRTFAKVIDEFNYIRITMPIQKMGKAEDKKKKLISQ